MFKVTASRTSALIFILSLCMLLYLEGAQNRHVSFEKNVIKETLSLTGFEEIQKGVFRASQTPNGFHSLNTQIALVPRAYYRFQYDILNLPRENANLTADLYAPGYDNLEQELGNLAGMRDLRKHQDFLFNLGKSPEYANFRLFYSGEEGLEVTNIKITYVAAWSIWLKRVLLASAFLSLLIFASQAIKRVLNLSSQSMPREESTSKNLLTVIPNVVSAVFGEVLLKSINSFKEEPKWFNFFILGLSFFSFGYFATRLGQDFNWDLRNYHYYNAYAFLQGRIGFDYAPAGIQTYINPIIYVPFFILAENFSPIKVAFIIGGIQGINFWLIYKISILFVKKQKIILALIIATVGMYTPMVIGALGTSYADLFISLLILSSLLILLKNFENETNNQSKYTKYILSGFFMGAAVGLKLTAFIFLIASFLALLPTIFLLQQSMEAKLKLLFSWAFGITLGVAISAGYSMHILHKQFSSPLFPFYNTIFHSPYFEYVNFADTRYVPEDYLQLIFYPFYWNYYLKFHYQDFGLAILFLCIFILFPLVIYKVKKNQLNVRALDPKLIFLFGTVFISYIIWLLKFSIDRYLVPVQLLAPLLIFILLSSVQIKYRLHLTLVIFVFIVYSVRAPYFSERIPYNDVNFFKFNIPLIESKEDGLIIQLAAGDPLSYVLPSMPKSFRVLRIGNGEWQWTKILFGKDSKLGKEVKEIINNFYGPIYLLTTKNSLQIERSALEDYNLKIVPNSQQNITPDILLFTLRQH